MSLHLVTPAAPAANTGVVDIASARPRRGTRDRLRAFRRGTVERVTGSTRPPLHAALAVERDYAITVRAASLATARHSVEAIGRMIPAVVIPGQHRCRIEAATQGDTPMTIMVEAAAGDPQTLDTVLRCLESIAGAPLRAKVIIHEPNRTHVRSWAGTWIEPEPRGRRLGGGADAPVAPSAA